MPSWKKLISSGSSAVLSSLTLDSPLAVAQGGTGAATLTSGYALLGNGTSAPQMINSTADSTMLVGNGSTMVAETGATLRTSIGVGTGDSPQFTAVNIGAASDTTLARSSAGVLSVEGNVMYHAGGTDVVVADGGTGASTFTDGGILFGNGTDAIQASAVLSAGEILIGDGTTEPTILDVGSASGIEILGTIGTGVWNGTEIYDQKKKVNAKIMIDGSIKYQKSEGSIHKVAAKILGAESCNGWTYWYYQSGNSLKSIDELRQRLRPNN